MSTTDWIAVDWGTSHMRAWAMTASGDILQRAASDKGMGSLSPDQFEAALLEQIEPWLRDDALMPVLACGMVGARQGWCEAPYTQVPCTPLAADQMVKPAVKDARIAVHIIPGLCQQGPADVMRGEETQIAGFMAEHPHFVGVLCLPGTHCKWADLRDGKVLRFHTYMTGELFALLSQQSVLRHGMQQDAAQGMDEAVFLQAVNEAFQQPQQLSSALFGLRAAGLLQGLGAAAARARLSGLLIGNELAAAAPLWQGHAVSIIGDQGLSALYAKALQAQGIPVATVSAEQITLNGLRAAWQQLARSGS